MHHNSQNEHSSNSQLTSGPVQSSLVEAKGHPPRSSTPFTRLPSSLFLAIIDFNFIDIKTLLLVCKRFYDMISKDQTLTRQRGIARIVKEKLGVSLFNPKLTRLTITDGSLSTDEIKQLLHLLPKLDLERITTPEEAPFEDLFQCATEKWSSFALTSINASFSLPELKKLPLKGLVLSIGRMSVSELNPAILDQLVSALPQAPKECLALFNNSPSLDEEKLDEQKRSHFFTHVLERLAQAGNIIDRPLGISIGGFISIRNMDLLIQFLRANPAIDKLHIAGKFFTDEKEDPKKLFAELKKTRLVTLHVETELSVDACRQLGENLPDSVENLYLPRGLETSHLEAFTAKLTEKNIKSLSLKGHRILDFSPLAKLLSKLPQCIDLDLTPASDVSKHAAQLDDVLRRQESQKLLDAACNNFNLIALFVPYEQSTAHSITYRNITINRIKKILLNLELPHNTWGLTPSKRYELLNQSVPALIQSALKYSRQLVNTNPESQAYLQSHETCEQICADFQERVDTLHRHDQAVVLQNALRCLFAQRKYQENKSGIVSSSSPAQADNLSRQQPASVVPNPDMLLVARRYRQKADTTPESSRFLLAGRKSAPAKVHPATPVSPSPG